MNRIHLIAFFLFFSVIIYAQAPASFHYQAVLRDPSGNPIASQIVSFRISILNGTITGSIVYAETHLVTTNEFGVVDLSVGNGAPIDGSGKLTDISWGSSTNFIKIEVDTQGGSNFEFMGVSQLLSVPYAFHADHAKTADNGFSGEYKDLKNAPDLSALDSSATNEIQTLSTNGNTVTLSQGGGSFTFPAVVDNSVTNEIQRLSITGNTVTLDKNGGSIRLPAPADNSATNEIQTLSMSGRTVTLSRGGGSFTIPAYTAGSGITITNNRISVATAARVNIGDRVHGGIVFFVNSSGTHGLVLSANDAGIRDWFGARNAMVNPALMGGEFTDWRLPSADECPLIQQNLVTPGIVNLVGKYWTMSELQNVHPARPELGPGAFNFFFAFTRNSGVLQSDEAKSRNLQVRGVRSF